MIADNPPPIWPLAKTRKGPFLFVRFAQTDKKNRPYKAANACMDRLLFFYALT
ncbi:hypothetical protein H650_03470 [Enterobacter sp. R4-368]|nr:hypothetical protein H650_03470 [Enterobacter sp. R4-368]